MIEPSNRPRRTCDIVMKGGITSGVVYPKAITTLAKRFTFINIGGTSAGAIAAAAAAAAEYRRQTNGSEDGFKMLDDLPRLLSESPRGSSGTRLFNLFQPNAKTGRIFTVAISALGGGTQAWQAMLIKLLTEYYLWALIGGYPGLMLAITSVIFGSGVLITGLWFLISLLLMLIGAILAAAAGLVREALREVPANGYGLCSGITDSSNKPKSTSLDQVKPLTPWLTGYLNEVAGLDPAGKPLTFSDLWGTNNSDPEEAPRKINLEMMTTNLTHGRPFRLPFRDDDDLRENYLFYFRPDEFRRYFPEHVVQWLIDHPRDAEKVKADPARLARRARLKENGYLPLPDPGDLPVVVATRMSLSFPLLLCAVPLHSIDRSVFSKNEQPERTWFSDGGMCSNFPLHFFDTALPRRPTFSIDLTEKPTGTAKVALAPEMDRQNFEDPADRWNRFDTETPTQANQLPDDKPNFARLLGFLSAMIATMQNWTDATQGRLPGFRDRIVRVPLTPDEGGLNLNMPPERIAELTSRGARAAQLLVDHFDVPANEKVMTWDNHRWVRLRAYLASLEKSLSQLVMACDQPENGDLGYQAWLGTINANEELAPSYRMNKTQLISAVQTLARLQDIFALWQDPAATNGTIASHDNSAAHDAPRPRPVLRPRAQI